MSFPAPGKIGRYEIYSQLGAGGMAEVYLAKDTKLDRKVALTILPAKNDRAFETLHNDRGFQQVVADLQ